MKFNTYLKDKMISLLNEEFENPHDINKTDLVRQLQIKQQNIPQKSLDKMKQEKFISQNKIENNSDTSKKITPNKNQHQNANYRADIDGLRTIAVAIVVIFHFWPKFMPGGFIGVDIFFVISGFLISGIIIKQTRKDQFSYLGFYSRRIKRIYPALILVLSTVLLIGFTQLMNAQFLVIAKTMSAASIFGANIQILTYDKGYFDPDVKTNSLLHLWSLGVEQQFYFIWPFIIMIVLKFFKNKAFFLLSIFTIVSFAFSIIMVYISPKFAFYFPLCRFWQMSIGGLIAYRKLKTKNYYVSNGFSIVSLGAILLTVWSLNENNLFPGFWALIPTISAGMIILTDNESLFNKFILSSPPFVFIGKISYPLYLWHWPLIVYSQMFYPEGSSSIFSNKFFVLFLAVILSILTYYVVENPLRFRKQKTIVFILLFLMLIIGLVSFIAVRQQQVNIDEVLYDDHTNLLPQQQDYYIKNGRKIINSSKNKNRMKPKKQILRKSSVMEHFSALDNISITSPYYDRDIAINSDFFEVLNEGDINKKKLLLIGDSHAQFIRYRFLQLYNQSKQQNKTNQFPTVIAITKCANPFLPCSLLYNSTLNYIKKHKPDRILFVHDWFAYLTYDYSDLSASNRYYKDCGDQYFLSQKQTYQQMLHGVKIYTDTMKELKNMRFNIYVATISPEGQKLNPKNMYDSDGVIQQNIQPLILSSFLQKNQDKYDLLESSMKNIGISMIDFTQNTCWQDKCEVLTPYGRPITRDKDHFKATFVRYWMNSVDFMTEF